MNNLRRGLRDHVTLLFCLLSRKESFTKTLCEWNSIYLVKIVLDIIYHEIYILSTPSTLACLPTIGTAAEVYRLCTQEGQIYFLAQKHKQDNQKTQLYF
jgi:hypothetical protein